VTSSRLAALHDLSYSRADVAQAGAVGAAVAAASASAVGADDHRHHIVHVPLSPLSADTSARTRAVVDAALSGAEA
jgi:hypothetical protein